MMRSGFASLRLVYASAAALLLFAPSADADLLSDLIAGSPPTLSSTSTTTPPYTVIGSNWGYTSTGDMPPATGINVNPTTDAQGNAGFLFQGSFHDSPGGGDSDGLITYHVSLSAADIAAGKSFTDVHLQSDVTVVGGDTSNLGHIAIVELVRDQNGNVLGTLTNFDTWSATGETSQRSDTLFLDPNAHYTTLFISKNILASSDRGNAVPQASFIVQTYSVPEPSSVTLVGLGAVGGLVGGVMRRRMLRTVARDSEVI